MTSIFYPSFLSSLQLRFSDAPLFLQGVCYDTTVEKPPQSFSIDFSSRPWITYRKGFPLIAPGERLSSDAGWGCMHRTGQMLMAEALLRITLGRDFRWTRQTGMDVPTMTIPDGDRKAEAVLRMFLDYPSDSCPFSIHRIVQVASAKMQKPPGEWMGPSEISHCFALLTEIFLFTTVRVIVCNNGGIYKKEIESKPWVPAVILIPLRLGLENLQEVYSPCLLKTFQLPQSLGILGGRPRSSLYFVGCQGENLLYLDPHVVQDVLPLRTEDFETYRCFSPQMMHLSGVDPSMCFGFLCRTEEEFSKLFSSLQLIMSGTQNPIFSLAEENPLNGFMDDMCDFPSSGDDDSVL